MPLPSFPSPPLPHTYCLSPPSSLPSASQPCHATPVNTNFNERQRSRHFNYIYRREQKGSVCLCGVKTGGVDGDT